MTENDIDLAQQPAPARGLAGAAKGAAVSDTYFDLAHMIERLHRRYLDVVRAALTRIGVDDVNPVQALMLTNIGDEEVVVRDLVERGYYLGSNASYNIKKLTEAGYLEQARSTFDRRSVRIKLTGKGQELRGKLQQMERSNADALAEGAADGTGLAETCRLLRKLERVWSDFIQYGPR